MFENRRDELVMGLEKGEAEHAEEFQKKQDYDQKIRDLDLEKTLIEDEIHRIIRTGRQPTNGTKGTKKNRSFISKSNERDATFDSISDCASNNQMEIPQDDYDIYIKPGKKSIVDQPPAFGRDSLETNDAMDMLKFSQTTNDYALKTGPLSNISEGFSEESSDGGMDTLKKGR